MGLAFYLEPTQPQLAETHVYRSVLYLKAHNLVLRGHCDFQKPKCYEQPAICEVLYYYSILSLKETFNSKLHFLNLLEKE